MHPLTYPQDIQCVYQITPACQTYGRIFIGNLQAAKNLQTLKKHSIRAVVTASKGTFLRHTDKDLPSYLYIPGEDAESFDMSQYFQKTSEFIDRNIPYTNVLVHCLAGVSRSVSIVIAHLIRKLGLSYEACFLMIKRRRQIINPNTGFVSQLKRLAAELRLQEKSLSKQKRQHSPRRQGIIKNNPEKEQENSIRHDYLRLLPQRLSAGEQQRQLHLRQHNMLLQQKISELRRKLNGSILTKQYFKRSQTPKSATSYSPPKYMKSSSPGRIRNNYDNYRLKTETSKTSNLSSFRK